MIMDSELKILYLYSELIGYQIPIFEVYVRDYNAKVHVVSWDKNKLKPYNHPLVEGVSFYKRSKYSRSELLELTKIINPDIVYVSGWMDKDYLFCTKYFVKIGVPVVAGFDDIWFGKLRQRMGALIFPIFYKKCFSHAWVAGPYQYEYAKKIGFNDSEIIYDLLTANTDVFDLEKLSGIDGKTVCYNSFLYVGNFRHRKGTDILIQAFIEYKKKYEGSWKLICVGNGEMEDLLVNQSGVEVYPFSDEKNLIQIARSAGAFILPSRHDQWGVVVHEFASLGLPLLLSDNVGSRAIFLIDNFNGFLFQKNSIDDLACKMHEISKRSTTELRIMGNNSYLLSKRVSIASSTANFMSLIDQK